VAAYVAVPMAERGEPGDNLGAEVVPLGAELGDGGLPGRSAPHCGSGVPSSQTQGELPVR
jgi:hypothetical protein